MPVDRQRLAAAPAAYFEAVDRKDLAGVLGFFAEDATFTVQTANLTLRGREEVGGMFKAFFADYETIRHQIANVVVDEKAGRASTEQECPHVRNDGTPERLYTCNFFDFAPDGRFQRVTVWIDGVSPLVAGETP